MNNLTANTSRLRTWAGWPAVAILLCALLPPLSATAAEPRETGDHEIVLTLNDLLGAEQASRYKEIIAPDKEVTWEVYLPDNDTTARPGVMVYISPIRSGKIGSGWREVMDQQNLIYISANHSGNRQPVKRRVVLAVTALKALGRTYTFDERRIIVSGFSGGGRVASFVASQFPGLFTGAIYICGVDPWKEEYSPKIDRMLPNRFVFLTGSKDFNRDETRAVYQRYLEAGAVHSKLMVIPGMAHELPGKKDLNEALDYLGASSDSVSG